VNQIAVDKLDLRFEFGRVMAQSLVSRRLRRSKEPFRRGDVPGRECRPRSREQTSCPIWALWSQSGSALERPDAVGAAVLCERLQLVRKLGIWCDGGQRPVPCLLVPHRERVGESRVRVASCVLPGAAEHERSDEWVSQFESPGSYV
jgi:hypothetical protein